MLDGAARDLRELQERIAEPAREPWTTGEALDDVLALWGDLLAIRLECPPAALARLDASLATRAALVDVVAEALTNAVRHGGAGAVDVRIALAGEERLAVTVRDDGRSTMPGAPGMGSRLLDAVAIGWALEAVDGGSELRVELSLDAAGAALPAGV